MQKHYIYLYSCICDVFNDSDVNLSAEFFIIIIIIRGTHRWKFEKRIQIR